jgi:hypothetical protein
MVEKRNEYQIILNAVEHVGFFERMIKEGKGKSSFWSSFMA